MILGLLLPVVASPGPNPRIAMLSKVRFGKVPHQSGWETRKERDDWIRQCENKAQWCRYSKGHSPDHWWSSSWNKDQGKQGSIGFADWQDLWPQTSASIGECSKKTKTSTWDSSWQDSKKEEWKQAGWWSPSSGWWSPSSGFVQQRQEHEDSMPQQTVSSSFGDNSGENAAADTEEQAVRTAWEEASPATSRSVVACGPGFVVESADPNSSGDADNFDEPGLAPAAPVSVASSSDDRFASAASRFGANLVLPLRKKHKTEHVRPTLGEAFAALANDDYDYRTAVAANMQMMLPDGVDVPLPDSDSSPSYVDVDIPWPAAEDRDADLC